MPRKSSKSSPAPIPPTPSPTTVVREVGAGVFKDTCLQLLDEVASGSTEIVVTKHGRPVARVVREAGEPRSGFGFMRGTGPIVGDIVSPDPDIWGDLA